jgi:cytochrome c oxidase cbb3-type subunit 2
MRSGAETLRLQLEKDQEDALAQSKDAKKPEKHIYQVLELYDPQVKEVFSFDPSGGIIQNWVDENYILLEPAKMPYHSDHGVTYVQNPREFRISKQHFDEEEGWRYDPAGNSVKDLFLFLGEPIQDGNMQNFLCGFPGSLLNLSSLCHGLLLSSP